jgi:hypothetical protein
MKTTNKTASIYVTNRQRFVGSNTFSECMENGKYVAYSYGYHYPLYYFDGQKWYGNKVKYSFTTGKHRSQLRPKVNDITWVETQEIKDLINKGL